MRETSSQRGPGRHLISPRSRIHLQCAIAQPPRARVNLIKLVACRATFHWDSSAAIFFILIFDRQRKKFATKQCDQPKLFLLFSRRNHFNIKAKSSRGVSRQTSESRAWFIWFTFCVYNLWLRILCGRKSEHKRGAVDLSGVCLPAQRTEIIIAKHWAFLRWQMIAGFEGYRVWCF